MRYTIFFLVLLFLYRQSICYGQVYLSNNGAFISIKNHALLSIRGDIINQPTGTFNNTDTIDLIGDWQNDGFNQAFDSINSGIVRFTGADQFIKGNSITGFHDLSLLSAGIKYGMMDVEVDGMLLLNDRELNMGSHKVRIFNQDVDCVKNTNGFVSSNLDGGLSRFTNQVNSYFFPVGSSESGIIYRPVYFTPQESTLNEYNVGLEARDASLDGYDRDEKESWLCAINEKFYHRFYHTVGSSKADILIQYDSTLDGNYNSIAQWKPSALWKNTSSAINSLLGSFNSIEITDWTDFDSKNFALSILTKPFGDLGSDTFVYYGSSLELEASGGSSYQWTPSDFLSCTDCANPITTPDTSISYVLVTEMSNGCKHIDTINIEVIKNISDITIFIPNTITPNDDGANDSWIIRDLDKFPSNEVLVLNRWGDIVYSRKPYDNSFDGKFLGKNLPEGTYYYLVKIKVDEEIKTFDGPLTIIR